MIPKLWQILTGLKLQFNKNHHSMQMQTHQKASQHATTTFLSSTQNDSCLTYLFLYFNYFYRACLALVCTSIIILRRNISKKLVCDLSKLIYFLQWSGFLNIWIREYHSYMQTSIEKCDWDKFQMWEIIRRLSLFSFKEQKSQIRFFNCSKFTNIKLFHHYTDII